MQVFSLSMLSLYPTWTLTLLAFGGYYKRNEKHK